MIGRWHWELGGRSTAQWSRAAQPSPVEAGCPPAGILGEQEGCRLPADLASVPAVLLPPGQPQPLTPPRGSGQVTLLRTMVEGELSLENAFCLHTSGLPAHRGCEMPFPISPGLLPLPMHSLGTLSYKISLSRKEPSLSLQTPQRRIFKGSWCGTSLSALGDPKVGLLCPA